MPGLFAPGLMTVAHIYTVAFQGIEAKPVDVQVHIGDGGGSGGVFNVVTTSGSNEVHGDLYEFLRNDKLNSTDFFANTAGQKPAPFKFNQFE